jgi:hypothetical protein
MIVIVAIGPIIVLALALLLFGNRPRKYRSTTIYTTKLSGVSGMTVRYVDGKRLEDTYVDVAGEDYWRTVKTLMKRR